MPETLQAHDEQGAVHAPAETSSLPETSSSLTEPSSRIDPVIGPSRARAIITIGLMLGMLIAAMESTVISTAMPTVIGDLHGIHLYPWVFSAYLLTSTATVPIYGKLADLFGRRRIFLIATGIFLLGSMLSGASHSMPQLIAFRAIQGLGAGGVMPLTLTVIGDLYALRERARVQGLFTGMWGFASLSGPILGAALTEQLSWRWVFYVNLPFGLLAMFLVGNFLREPNHANDRHLEGENEEDKQGEINNERSRKTRVDMDYPGLILMTAGVVALLWLLLQLGTGLSLFAPSALALLTLTLVLITAFLRQEKRASEPLLPLALFANPIIAASTVGNILIGTMMYSIDSFMPLFMQGVRGGTAHSASLVLTPLVLLWALSAYAGAKALSRFGFRKVATFGAACILLSALGLALISAQTPTPIIVALMALLGTGMGPCSMAFLVSAQNAVAWQQRGVVTASSQFFRMISGTVGVGALGAVLNAHLAAALNAPLSGTPQTTTVGFTPNDLLNAQARAHLSPALLASAEHALASGLHRVFLLLAVLALVAFARILQLTARGTALLSSLEQS